MPATELQFTLDALGHGLGAAPGSVPFPLEPAVESGESSGLVRCVEVSKGLRDNLSVMKRLLGDKWAASAEEYKTIVRRVMLATEDSNPIACALPMATEMSKRGHSPLMLLAVATEMSQAPNAPAYRRRKGVIKGSVQRKGD